MAIDAAIATQLMLGLVEPQSSGIGGGAFILHFQADTGQLTSFDGRETAPAAAGPATARSAASAAAPGSADSARQAKSSPAARRCPGPAPAAPVGLWLPCNPPPFGEQPG